MAKEQKKAKGTNETKPAKRKLDPEMEELRKPERGKKKHQQLKAYMVLECLMRETNEKKPLSARDIVAYLDDFGISAEATSVRNDIKEINYVMYMLEYGCTIDIAIEELDSGDYEEDKFIKYSQKKKGYYVSKYRNNITETDARTIAECIYASPFVSTNQIDHLIDVACSLVDTRAAERIKRDTFVRMPSREISSNVFYNVSTILEAMSEGTVDEPHIPEKIEFTYQCYCIDDANSTVKKENCSRHKVSPYKIYVNEHYYLRAFDDKEQKMMSFPIENMANIKLTKEARDGEEENELDGDNYDAINSFFASQTPIKAVLLCRKRILDSVVLFFGTGADVEYSTYDDDTFTLTTNLYITPKLFQFLSRFPTGIKIIQPDILVRRYLNYLKRMEEKQRLYDPALPKMKLNSFKDVDSIYIES